MRRWNQRSAWTFALLALIPPACTPEADVDTLPSPREVLDSIGRRLARSHREADITAIARDSRRLLGELRPDERFALAHDLIRFRVDQPVVVDVATTPGEEPFWLIEQGFRATGVKVSLSDRTFELHRRRFDAGWIGLGVNSLDRSTSSHYFAIVRAERENATLGLQDVTGAIPGGVSDSPFVDDSRIVSNWPTEFAHASLLRTSQSARHDSTLLKGRAWKTKVPSTRVPDQVAIAVGADASRSLAITWRTAIEGSDSSIRIAQAVGGRSEPIDAESIRVISGSAAPIRSDGLVNDPVIRRHRVVVNGLIPDTEYLYAIEGEAGQWTPWQVVRTAPEPSNSDDLRFLYMGDPQCGLEEWGKLLSTAHRKEPDAAFLLIAGDLVDRGNERTNWDHFFLRARGVFESMPMMPSVGNHEYLDDGPRIFRANFALPDNGPAGDLVYSFEAGGAIVAVLDSEAAAHDLDSARRQAEWLDRTLAKSRRTWKFVMFHHPLYPSHESRPSPENLKKFWLPVIDRHRVDIVFQGHDHAYLRTFPMRGDRVAPRSDQGTVFVVSVSGTKFSPASRRDYAARFLTETPTYQSISIDSHDRRLTYRAIDRRGVEVDRFELEAKLRDEGLAKAPTRSLQ